MAGPLVQLFVGHPFLAEAMIRALQLDLGEADAIQIDDVEETADGAVVLAVPSSCSPAVAEEVRKRGGRLLLLTPVLDRRERERYERAGARVALMDSRNLTAQVRHALTIPASRWTHDELIQRAKGAAKPDWPPPPETRRAEHGAT